MLPRNHSDCIQIAFDDCRLVANTGDKIMTLVASALAGGDCIDDADALRTGGTACTLGSTVKAPSTLGTFLRSFRWGHVRQLDRVSRELLARAWAAGAGPGDAPFTIDLDSTVCETSRLTGFFRARPPPVLKAGRYPGAHHRTRAPAGSPVVPPGALPYATPAADTVSRSIPRRHPRTGGRSAAWNR